MFCVHRCASFPGFCFKDNCAFSANIPVKIRVSRHKLCQYRSRFVIKHPTDRLLALDQQLSIAKYGDWHQWKLLLQRGQSHLIFGCTGGLYLDLGRTRDELHYYEPESSFVPLGLAKAGAQRGRKIDD